jgi:hypothetical protein
VLVLGALALLRTAGWGAEVFWGQQNGVKYRLAAGERGDFRYVSTTGTLNP